MILGQTVKSWRVENNLSLRDLAGRIGVSHCTLDHFERGDRNIKSDPFLKILLWLMSRPNKQNGKP